MTPSTMADCELIQASLLLREEIGKLPNGGMGSPLIPRQMAIIREMNRRVDELNAGPFAIAERTKA